MFNYEILNNWTDVKKIKSQWNELHVLSNVDHPFTTYGWFDCWYSAFCKPGQERIILLKDGNDIRAIFPGMVEQYQKGLVKFNRFSYAGNGHSPRCGIIAKKNDYLAIQAILLAPFCKLLERFYLISFPALCTSSDTHAVLMGFDNSKVFLYKEYSFESPAFEMPDGWATYLGSRSKSFRQDLRAKRNKLHRVGEVHVDFVESSKTNSTETIDQLKKLDAKTWQGKNGTGLFSNKENSIFYSNLLRIFSEKGDLKVCFVTVNSCAIAYQLYFLCNSISICLKTGYDPKYRKNSPGRVLKSYLGELWGKQGVNEVDLIGECNQEKERWETKRREHGNYWLIDPRSIKGRLFVSGLQLKKIAKARGV